MPRDSLCGPRIAARAKRVGVAALLVLASLSGPGCVVIDENGNNGLLGDLLEYFTWIASGQLPPSYLAPPMRRCPTIGCLAPYCTYVQENGDFEARLLDGTVAAWFGDETLTGFTSCDGGQGLRFWATTPQGASASASAQVFQVIDYGALVPPEARINVRRVRAMASFNISLESDDFRFGLHLAAYSGEPLFFPREGDYETFAVQTPVYTRLAFNENFFQADDDPDTWEPLETEALLPEGTNFVVVVLEAFEDGQNDAATFEFDAHYVDGVEVVFDTGNTRPFVSDDGALVDANTPRELVVLRNDRDVDSPDDLDPSSVVIVSGPDHGSAVPAPDGVVTYTPETDYTGEDAFTYTVADRAGIVSDEAVVRLTVREPVQCRIVSAGSPMSRFQCDADAPLCRQLLMNADFEEPVRIGENLPTDVGFWESSDTTEVVGAERGVSPCSGGQMLAFRGSSIPGFPSAFQNQVVNFTTEERARIAVGEVEAVVRVLFNRVTGDSETGTRFTMRVLSYPGTYPDSWDPLAPALLNSNEVVLTDGDPATWEEAYVSFVPPAPTGYLIVQIWATDTAPPDFDGHYADDARVMLRPIE